MSVSSSALCVLRDPTPAEASRWYKPRNKPAAVRLKLLADFLVQDPTIRFTKKTDAVAELLCDTGNGTSLRLTMEKGAIDVRVGPFVLGPDQTPMPHARYVDHVTEFIEVLQVGGGFYVYSDELVGFDPSGACPKCGLEVFEWQDSCAICDAKLFPVRDGEDPHDARASRVVDVLLRRGMIELASPRGRRNVERTVSMYYAYGRKGAELLTDLLMEMEDVAEVYCDDRTLHRLLDRVK